MFRIRYRYVFILSLGVYSYFNILYTVGERLFDFPLPDHFLFLILLLVISGIWELNRFIEIRLGNTQSIFHRRVHPLLILFLFSMINVIIVSAIGIQLLYYFLDMPLQLNTDHLKLLTAFGFRVNLFLNCINAIVFYMTRLRNTQLESEQFKKNLIEAQYEALRNQINPHFLFNCFNVLSTLVYKDADTASKFISQLSVVYRYLLYNQEKRIVLLKEELVFMDAYLFLLKIRFGENIEITNQIKKIDENFYVAPAVLQMLVENAIKHNVISRKLPLRITFSVQKGYLIVINNLQEKAVKEESLQIGLNNIKNRYAFLSDRPVSVLKNENSFIVSVPLLEVKEI